MYGEREPEDCGWIRRVGLEEKKLDRQANLDEDDTERGAWNRKLEKSVSLKRRC